MGLDISAYSKIEVVRITASHDDSLAEDWDSDINQDWLNEHFPHACPGFPVGHWVQWRRTDATKDTSFRAGSYSGYGLWRSMLSGVFLDTKDLYSDRDDANGDWEKVYDSEGKPFWELVNFSDCDGIFIGPVCEKLYNDFATHRDDFVMAANPYPAWDKDYFVNKYDEFTTAFEYAADGGLVTFH